jgi:hypothetical protein
MPQKPKARKSASKPRKSGASPRPKGGEKTQAERFIETARAIGVDESGVEFDRALKRLVSSSKR